MKPSMGKTYHYWAPGGASRIEPPWGDVSIHPVVFSCWRFVSPAFVRLKSADIKGLLLRIYVCCLSSKHYALFSE